MLFDDPLSPLKNWLDLASLGQEDSLELGSSNSDDWEEQSPIWEDFYNDEKLGDDISNDDMEWSEFSANSNWDSSQFDGWGCPIEDADCWQEQEGTNSCAVVAQVGVYESITGIKLSEAEACQTAADNGWYDPESGTVPNNVGKFLATMGIPTEQSYDATLVDLADALERGDKVIVGLDANEISNPIADPVTGLPLEQANGGHAVWVTGIDRDPDGTVKIILNDSGTPDGRMKAVEVEDFLNAWEDYGNFLVVAHPPDRVV
jgi:hypothetical protein